MANSEYFKTDSKVVNYDNEKEVISSYANGYVFTRLGKGNMDQTRSLRIDLAKFDLSSENRRILRKTEDLEFVYSTLPLENYTWEIHKLGKDFYTTKFGDGTMSAVKIKEMFNDIDKSNMNGVFIYSNLDSSKLEKQKIGYCLVYNNNELIHYAYPFYDLSIENLNLGMGMMIRAVQWAKENNKKYVYLGSVTTKSSLYKLQFKGLELWDDNNNAWNVDIQILKNFYV